VLVPSTDTTAEDDLPRLLGDHASVHFTRMSLPAVTPAGLAHMEDSARAAIVMLADIRPDVVLFACTSGSFFQGAEHERELAADLESIAGAPVVTTARAMVEALARRGQRVRLRTPYSDELTALEVAYLEHAGLTVASSAGLGIVDDLEIAAVPPDTLRALVRGDDAADVVMLSCTNVRALAVLSMLRDAACLDVVTSNLAGAEAVVRALESRAG
jgi:maleate isomerase